jgi:VIT1/CCC1 family predicted Fe2+/Mn2+ transporter
MALFAGLDAASGARATIIASLLIFALADNLTDSLSLHVYQESEQLDDRAAFHATLANFVTRLGLTLSFVLIVVLLPSPVAVIAALVWGLSVLAALTAILAHSRGESVVAEVGKHLALAIIVISVSRIVGIWLQRALS